MADIEEKKVEEQPAEQPKKLTKKEELERDISFYQERYFTFDEPVPFDGLTLYPATVRNYNSFMSSSTCCTLNKNDDPEGLRLTHLDYLMKKLKDEKDGPLWCTRLTKLVEVCMHIENGYKCPKCGKHISITEFFMRLSNPNLNKEDIDKCECGEKMYATIRWQQNEKSKKRTDLVIDNHVIDADSFYRLRKILMYQNVPDWQDDEDVIKEIRDDQAARSEILSKGQGKASLERKMCCLCVKTGFHIEDLYDMPIRKFSQMLGIADDLINYETTKLGLMTGMVSLKDGSHIDHWIYKKERSLMEGMVEAESFKNQIKSAN